MHKLRISEQVTLELEEPIAGLSVSISDTAAARGAQSAARRAILNRE
jgi:hypothetical protein